MRARIEAIRSDLWLIREPGSRNPVSVVFRRGGDLFVTDPGVARKSRGKNECIRDLASTLGARIHGILLTHSHPDHIGNLPLLLGPDTRVYLHRRAFWSLRSPGVLLKAERALTRTSPMFHAWQERLYPAFARLAYGPGVRGLRKHGGRHDQYQEFPASSLDFDGYSAVIVRTPGHTPGEVSFWVPEGRILVTGDLVPNTHVGRDHIPSLYMPECNVYEALASLSTLETLRPEQLVPAHGEPIRGESAVAARLRALRDSLEAVVEQVSRRRRMHPDTTIGTLADRVFDTLFPRVVPGALGRIERHSIVLSVLRDRDRVQRS